MRKMPWGGVLSLKRFVLNFEEKNGFPFDNCMYQLSFKDVVRNGFLICKNTMSLTS